MDWMLIIPLTIAGLAFIDFVVVQAMVVNNGLLAFRDMCKMARGEFEMPPLPKGNQFTLEGMTQEEFDAIPDEKKIQ